MRCDSSIIKLSTRNLPFLSDTHFSILKSKFGLTSIITPLLCAHSLELYVSCKNVKWCFWLYNQRKIARRLIDLFNPLTFKDWNLKSKLGWEVIAWDKGRYQRNATVRGFECCP